MKEFPSLPDSLNSAILQRLDWLISLRIICTVTKFNSRKKEFVLSRKISWELGLSRRLSGHTNNHASKQRFLVLFLTMPYLGSQSFCVFSIGRTNKVLTRYITGTKSALISPAWNVPVKDWPVGPGPMIFSCRIVKGIESKFTIECKFCKVQCGKYNFELLWKTGSTLLAPDDSQYSIYS